MCRVLTILRLIIELRDESLEQKNNLISCHQHFDFDSNYGKKNPAVIDRLI